MYRIKDKKMKLEPVITYELSSYDPLIPSCGSVIVHTDAKFDSVSSLRQSIPFDMGPNTKMTVKRFINVIDADYVPNEIEAKFLPRNDLLNGKPVKIKEDGGRIDFFIADKPQFVDDIYKMLYKKYERKLLYIPWKPIPLNKPCIITQIETDELSKRRIYTVDYRSLNQNEIIVDKNFNQIWPDKTNIPPIAMIELLNKKTEKIY